MPIYEFPVRGDRETLPPPEAAQIKAVLAQLGLSEAEVQVEPLGKGGLHLTGIVLDGDMHEKLLVALGNLPNVAFVDDHLAQRRTSPLLDTLGAFARLPPGTVTTEMAEEMVHDAAPGRRHNDDMLGPAGSALHVVRPGETLDDIARAHHGDAIGALRILHANRPMLERADALKPGMVVRVPPLPLGG